MMGGQGMFNFGAGNAGRFGRLLSNANNTGITQIFGNKGKFSGVGNIFRDKNKAGNYDGQKFNMGKLALGGLGAASLAPLFMGGGDDDGPIDQMDPSAVTQRARNFYSGQGDAGVGLDFMPQKKYVNQNFYAADGGRAGYAGGGEIIDEEEEFM